MLDEKNHRKMYDKLKEKDRQIIELDFDDTPEKLKGEYLDMYHGINKGGGKISYIRTRLYSRKITRWYRMENTLRYRSKYIILF